MDYESTVLTVDVLIAELSSLKLRAEARKGDQAELRGEARVWLRFADTVLTSTEKYDPDEVSDLARYRALVVAALGDNLPR